jgi:hypothetical protein
VATVDLIATGDRALAAGDWTGARAAFERALAGGESAEALDGLGQALWWLNELAEALELRQRAYAEFVRRGERGRAIGIAVFLAREFFMVPTRCSPVSTPATWSAPSSGAGSSRGSRASTAASRCSP